MNKTIAKVAQSGYSGIKESSCWGVDKVERILYEVGIMGYELINKEKVVNVVSQGDLKRLLLYLVPYEVSSEYNLMISKAGGKYSVRIGCWSFQAE